mmetsp:Transcript_10494/g.32597  ORF Transcript_10494/g.32597 Transcript_10494/m.32597 type:complete len:233 (-) Transcript_10494:1508-2206(-)
MNSSSASLRCASEPPKPMPDATSCETTSNSSKSCALLPRPATSDVSTGESIVLWYSGWAASRRAGSYNSGRCGIMKLTYTSPLASVAMSSTPSCTIRIGGSASAFGGMSRTVSDGSRSVSLGRLTRRSHSSWSTRRRSSTVGSTFTESACSLFLIARRSAIFFSILLECSGSACTAIVIRWLLPASRSSIIFCSCSGELAISRSVGSQLRNSAGSAWLVMAMAESPMHALTP